MNPLVRFALLILAYMLIVAAVLTLWWTPPVEIPETRPRRTRPAPLSLPTVHTNAGILA